MANPNISEIVTTTLVERSGELADNFTGNTALLSKLRGKDKVRPFTGGSSIYEEIFYSANGTYTRYQGYDPLNIAPSDVISAAEFNIKQCAVAVSMSGLEALQNAGKNQVIDLLASRIDNAEMTLVENMSTDVYSDGTADSSKQIGGLQLLVSDAGTGTVGGIISGTYTWWQNQVYDFSNNSVTAGPGTIQTAMNTLYLNCKRNRDVPDLIVMDNTYFRYYQESLQAHQRFTNEKMAAAGFDNLKFMQAEVVADGGQNGDCPSSHGYFLNTNHIFWRPHKNRNFVPIGGDRFSTNQDAFVRLIGVAGNMTIRNRALQGVLVS